MKNLFISVVLILPALFLLGQAKFSDNQSDYIELVKKVTENKEIEIKDINGFRVAELYTDTDSVYYFFQTNDIVNVDGYQGHTNLGVIINKSGMIKSVEILESEDSRFFVRKIENSGFFDQFINKKKIERIRTVTGATITSKAITKSVRACMEMLFN